MSHPIDELIAASLQNLKNMVDVDTIVGKPIMGQNDNTMIIPISKVKMAFASRWK